MKKLISGRADAFCSRTLRRAVPVVLLVFTAAGAFAKKAPAWIDNPYSGYDEKSYICAVGTGLKSDDADKKALSDVAAVLQQNISSVEVVQQAASSEGFNLSSYLADITTQSDIKNISGLSIKERYKDKKNRCYSLAVLDKGVASKSYSLLLNKNSLEIESLLDLAEQKSGSLDECRNLIQAYKITRENDYYASLLAVLKPAAHHSFSYGSSGEISARIKKAFGKITVSVLVNGDSDGRINAAAGEAINGFGFRTQDGAAARNAVYSFTADVSFEDIEKSESSDIYFTRCIVSWSLKEVSSGNTVLTSSGNSRQGKLSRAEARQSAVRAAETFVKENFSSQITQLFEK